MELSSHSPISSLHTETRERFPRYHPDQPISVPPSGNAMLPVSQSTISIVYPEFHAMHMSCYAMPLSIDQIVEYARADIIFGWSLLRPLEVHASKSLSLRIGVVDGQSKHGRDWLSKLCLASIVDTRSTLCCTRLLHELRIQLCRDCKMSVLDS